MNMTNTKHCVWLWLFALALLPGARAQETVAAAVPSQGSTAQAETSAPPAIQPIKLLSNYVEVGGSYLPLSNGFGHWSGGYARTSITQGRNVWFAEINGQHEFDDAGVYFAAGDTFNFNSDWYASLTVGSSAAGFFWPRFRADGFLNKKWLARKQFITTAGVGYYQSKDQHRDHNFFLGATYYFSAPWIFETGMHFNLSNPGTVYSPSSFVAVTQGRDKHYYLTVRVGLGEEAYQLVGPTASLNDFQSQTFTVTWRKWVHKSWGMNLIGDYYHNPFYSRGGTMLGIFKDF
jgi:YaiO family outer membrane protein